MSTTDSTTITPDQLRELHLNALQSIYNLNDQAIGAIEVILAVELAHWDISNTTSFTDLRNFLRARKPSLDLYFDVGDEAHRMITALEEHNGTLAERLAATQKELDALRANYANLSDINLEKERECDELHKTLETAAKEIELLRQAHNQATARAEAAEKKTADKQAAIDAFGLALIEGIATQEAGTAAATNPPAPAPSTPSTHTANLIARPHLPHDAAITALERQANGSNGAAANHEEPADATEEPAMTFDWSHLPLVYQTLINPLATKEIAWKSLSAEQKTKLAVEAAAQILLAQPDFPDTTLSHDLFNNLKPEWMTSLQGLAVGVPLQIQELRQLAVSRAQRLAVRNSHANGDANPQSPSLSSGSDSSEPTPGES